MKTIEEAAIDYAIALNVDDCELSKKAIELYAKTDFTKGAEFAQEWLLIEKDRDGFTTNRQQEEMANNLPFLLKGETEREELYHELDNDIDKQYYTHWRPLNRKKI